jgi:hypothetical protein
MRRMFFVVSPLILFGICLGQVTSACAATRITAGTLISAQLSKAMDAKKVKVDDKFEAKTVVDLLSNGEAIIPKGSKITGHITQVKTRSKDSKDSMIGIAFDSISMKDGTELAIQGTIQAIGRAPDSGGSSYSSMSGGPIGSSGGSLPSGGSGPASDSSGGSLGPNSQGVVGIRNLAMNASGQTSEVSSNSENVHLDAGTQLILRIQ